MVPEPGISLKCVAIVEVRPRRRCRLVCRHALPAGPPSWQLLRAAEYPPEHRRRRVIRPTDLITGCAAQLLWLRAHSTTATGQSARTGGLRPRICVPVELATALLDFWQAVLHDCPIHDWLSPACCVTQSEVLDVHPLATRHPGWSTPTRGHCRLVKQVFVRIIDLTRIICTFFCTSCRR